MPVVVLYDNGQGNAHYWGLNYVYLRVTRKTLA